MNEIGHSAAVAHRRPTPQEAFVQLARAATLAGRPGILVAGEDVSAVDALTSSRTDSHGLIASLERAGRIQRVRRGAYVMVDSTGGVRVGLLDLIGALTPGPHLVTGGRALQYHDLTDQHFRRVQVLVRRPLRSWAWRGDEVRYVQTDVPLRGGATRTRAARARVATPERAIADSLSHPRWGVTLAQVAEALDEMIQRAPDFPDRLAIEVARSGNHALARRLGLLVSRLAGPDASRPFLPLRGDSKASTPLQAGGPSDGPIDPAWRVRENVEVERLIQHREIG
jgi:predicted transcriptional regulator of viral defense system